MKIKLSKSQWEQIGKKAGWIKKANGWGNFSGDLSDVIEGYVAKGVQNGLDANAIFSQISSDSSMMKWISDEGGDNTDLMDCINENLQMHNVVNKTDDRTKFVKELEKYADNPNIRGFLSRIEESQYYRPAPKGHPQGFPSTNEIKQQLDMVKVGRN